MTIPLAVAVDVAAARVLTRWMDFDDRVPERPGPRGKTFVGPWLEQQVVLSFVIGLLAVLVFGVWKRHYPSVYLARHHAQGSALPYDRMRNSMFGWILPTLLYSDHSVLHTVGLDGVTALLFFKMGFMYLTLTSIWALFVLMPVHFYTNGWVDGVKPGESFGDSIFYPMRRLRKPKEPLPLLPLPTIVTRDTLYENTQLVSTFAYSLLAMFMLWRAYRVFISFRQSHSGSLEQSDTSRTVEVYMLPEHLTTDEALISYFESIRLPVESVCILKNTSSLDRLLRQRARSLFRLERLWYSWLGDDSAVENYDPAAIEDQTLAMSEPPKPGDAPMIGTHIRANRPRPRTYVPLWNWAGEHVDAIDQASYEFATLDRAVRALRDSLFPHTHTAFVTFQHTWSAQIAGQVVHYPSPGRMLTEPAVEPRDVIWEHQETAVWDRRVRQCIMALSMAIFLSITLSLDLILASLVNLNGIKVYFPWLGDLIDENLRLRAFVQNSLPTLLLISINALVPVAMRYSTWFQRIRAYSHIEHSVLGMYYLYLLFSVVFVFLFTSARDMLNELSESPMHMIDKLAQSLPVARNFSLAYVIFQGLAIQPFQLVLLPNILLRQFESLFCVMTPRRWAHLLSAPTLTIGTLYPQALLIFTLCVLYSIVSPCINVFGALYFGIGYVVVKYQLLNVFDRPYDSHGHAWPLAVRRCIWAVVLFQVFQLSLFSVRKQVLNSLLIVPLIGYTIWFAFHVQKTFLPLTSFVNLHDIYAAEEELRHRNEAYQDEPHSHIPSGEEHPGRSSVMTSRSCLLSVSQRTYKQPSLTGPLPTLWLPHSRPTFLEPV